MKKIILLFVSFVFVTITMQAQAQYANVPDANLRSTLAAKYPSCFTHKNDSLNEFGEPEMYQIPDGSGYVSLYGTYMMDITCASILNEDSLDLHGLGVKDMAGIQYFSSLTHLNAAGNPIYLFPTLPASLTYLDISNNISNDDPFATMPVLPASLTYLDCSNYANMGGAMYYQLPSLPASLRYLKCANTGLRGLPVLPTSLIYLDCSSQRDYSLTSSPPCLYGLPKLPGSLVTLICGMNAISSLPEIPASLKILDCTNMGTYDINYDSSYTLYCLPVLPFSLEQLFIPVSITCLPNYGLFDNGQSPASLPLCHGVSCPALSNVSGHVFIDNNGNGIKDADDSYRANTRINHSGGFSVYTNNEGFYKFPSETGTHSITVEAPGYYTATPSTIDFTFNTTITDLVLQDIALHPDLLFDSVTIAIIPYRNTARPGAPYSYNISYENTGTKTLDPAITIKYDNSILTYTSSSSPLLTDDGSSLHLADQALTPGQRKSFIVNFDVSTSALLNSNVVTTTSIAANQAKAADTSIVEVRGSFDPNDKQATAELLPEQVVQGKYIDYTIRFQNTGNDTAFHIIITDTLNSLLQAGTFQLINASHSCNVTLNGNIVLFDFPGILLPDKNINEPGSHGFVHFRIRPSLSAINSTIPNSAAIYFDYNAPVITNIATTLIRGFGTIPLKLVSFNAFEQPGNKVALYWSTANEINTRSFDIEQSIDGRNFSRISSMDAKGDTRNSYMQTVVKPVAPIIYYRLKIKAADARYNYSAIIRINSKKQVSGITILNNPVSGKINMRVIDPALKNTAARIINGQGAVVKSFLLLGTDQTVDVSILPAGNYYLQTQLATEKFVISK